MKPACKQIISKGLLHPPRVEKHPVTAKRFIRSYFSARPAENNSQRANHRDDPHSFSLLYKYAAVRVAVENVLKAVGSARHVEPAEELCKDLPIFSLLHKQGCELKDTEQWNVPVPCITGLLLLPAHCQGLTSEHKLPYLL